MHQSAPDLSDQEVGRRRIRYPEGATCAVVDCQSVPKAKWLCLKHYTRLIRHGDPDVDRGHVRKYEVGQQCSVDGCSGQADSRGWCVPHYQRWVRAGDPCAVDGRTLRKPKYEACTVDNCRSKPVAKGLCLSHYSFLRRRGDVAPAPAREFTGLKCRALDCQRDQVCRGYCDRHYRTWKRSGYSESEWHLHRMKSAAATQRRRAKVIEARTCEYTWADVMQRMAYFGNKCWMCGGPFEHVDHVKPLARGGADCPANFRPACASCNCSKGSRWYGVANLHRFLRVPQAA